VSASGSFRLFIFEAPDFISSLSNPGTWCAGHIDLSIEASHPGEKPARPDEIILVFISLAEKWRYFEEVEVLFVIDGKRMEAGKAYATDTIPGGRSIKEKLKLTLPIEKFEEIVGGKKVEMKLGPTQLQLEEKHMLALREFLVCATGQQ
jgi:hypothetical protein